MFKFSEARILAAEMNFLKGRFYEQNAVSFMLNLQPTSKKIKRFIYIIEIIKYNTNDSKGLKAELTELPTSSRSVPLAPVVMTWHGPIKSLLKFVNRQVNWLTWNIAIAGDVPITIVSYITLHLKFNIISILGKTSQFGTLFE